MSGPERGPVLLDTCALIWFMSGALPPPTEAMLIAAATTGGVFVSAVSAWEIGLLSRPGRALAGRLLPDAKAWFARAMQGPGFRPAPFTPEIAIDASHLPGNLHPDPADRMLIATARHLHVPIVTRDQRILTYAKNGAVAALPC